MVFDLFVCLRFLLQAVRVRSHTSYGFSEDDLDLMCKVTDTVPGTVGSK